ncbi:hypothetical protein GXW84_39430 [Rhodococcus sp. IEGM 248]|nr:hypothetical protein [Rhodococcus sp. IEGM 248]
MSTKESEIAADTFRRVLKNDLFESGESPNTSLYGEDTQLHLLRMFPEPEAEAGKASGSATSRGIGIGTGSGSAVGLHAGAITFL